MIETTEIEKRAAQQPKLPAPLAPLERLAWNYWWSWAADGAGIFRDLDPEIWEECENNPRQLNCWRKRLHIVWRKQLRIRCISNVCGALMRDFNRTWQRGQVGPSTI
jgi:hypothetical protein